MTANPHKLTWSAIMRSIDTGTPLVVVGPRAAGFAAPTEAKFVVRRTTSRGMYVYQQHANGTETNEYVLWPPAKLVKVLDSKTWMVSTVGGLQAWSILPDADH